MFPLALALALAAMPAAPAAPPADPVGGPPAPPPPSPAALPALTAAPAAPLQDDLPELRAYVVERIVIRGLDKGRSRAVRRHLLVKEGDELDDRDVLLSRLRLLQLGWFSQVDASVERGSERGRVTLVFRVVERNTLIVSDLVMGTTAPQPVYGGVGLTEQNLLGLGHSLGAAFVYGGAPLGRPADPDRFALRGSWFMPDLPIEGVGRLVAGASAWTIRGEEFACATEDCAPWEDDYAGAPYVRYRRSGGELTLGLRIGPFARFLGGVRLEAVSADAVPAPAPSAFRPPPIHLGDSRVAALTATWEYDSRNDFFLPREGLRLASQVTLSSALVGSDYEYSRYWLQAETAFALLGLPLRLQVQAGIAQGDAPFFDRFYAADLAYFAVGPALGRAFELNFSTDSRYDAFAAAGGLEWALPLERVRGRFFQRAYLAIGARAVWSSAELGGGRTDFSALPFSADLALRFDTPVGAFNASLGYALDNLL